MILTQLGEGNISSGIFSQNKIDYLASPAWLHQAPSLTHTLHSEEIEFLAWWNSNNYSIKRLSCVESVYKYVRLEK